jgi:hypothetical protein
MLEGSQAQESADKLRLGFVTAAVLCFGVFRERGVGGR